MKVKICIVGLGFMGKCHFDNYRKIIGADVIAICDVDPGKRAGDWSHIAGNIGKAGRQVDLKGIKTYSRFEDMLNDPEITTVDITLPTYLHAEYSILAMNAGKDVICEKPMALNPAEAEKMIRVSEKTGQSLFIGHCIRFWPQYRKAYEIIESKKYGNVVSACFRRLSAMPVWTWKNWILDSRKSGGAILDLHIHDADFIQYCFGCPTQVSTRSLLHSVRGHDHVVTSYGFGERKFVLAEGAWEYPAGFPFEMSFNIVLEKGTLQWINGSDLMVRQADGKNIKINVEKGDGYYYELSHFIECLLKRKRSEVMTPLSALNSIRLVEAEKKSAMTGRTVRFK